MGSPTRSPVAAFQRRILWSPPPPEASIGPSGSLQAASATTQSAWPVMGPPTRSPVVAFQRRIVRSPPPEASMGPSGPLQAASAPTEPRKATTRPSGPIVGCRRVSAIKPPNLRRFGNTAPEEDPLSRQNLPALTHHVTERSLVTFDCQGTAGLPCGRTADLPVGGRVMSL